MSREHAIASARDTSDCHYTSTSRTPDSMPQLLSPEEYQQLGRRYYKLGQFEKALETFNNAIGAFPTLGLHDGRAACCDKLGDDHAAVRDGKAMIRLDKQDVRGYLRTASMLVKMGQQETALGIYKYGMKNVPSNDKYFEVNPKRRAGCSDVHMLTHRRLCNNSTISSLASCPLPKPSIRSPSSQSKSLR